MPLGEAAGQLDALAADGRTAGLVTGDNQGTAQRIAKELGIDTVIADVLPGDLVSSSPSSGSRFDPRSRR